MKKTTHVIHTKSVTHLAASLAVGLLCATASVGHAQNFPPGVQDVVKLSQAGVSDDVILTQIRNNQATYNLTADQIIALKDQGISSAVIKALMGGPAVPVAAPVSVPSPAPMAVVDTPAAPTVTLDSFQAQLSASGTWIEVPGVGQCWQPTVALTDPNWRPYFDHGHWVYTDAGWSWQSDYSWGGVVFHYGRWSHFQDRWVWVPGYDWAPAWVCWREADGYCGWAPLPPAAVFRAGVGLYFHGGLAVDVDFGLGIDAFTFVGYDHFWEADYHAFRLPRERMELVFHGSHVLNGYRVDHGRFVVEGLGHEHMAVLTHHDVRVVREMHEEHNLRDVHEVRDAHDDRNLRDDHNVRDTHDIHADDSRRNHDAPDRGGEHGGEHRN